MNMLAVLATVGRIHKPPTILLMRRSLASIIVVSFWRRNHLDRDDLIGRLTASAPDR